MLPGGTGNCRGLVRAHRLSRRRDGPASRIAATTFLKWLAQETWPEEPTDRVLLDFALQRGVAGV